MKRSKAPSGQSLIEFALLIPMIFFLIMGLFDLGRAVFYYAVLNHAAREGSRYAVVQPYCHYRSDPGECEGGYLDAYPLNCEHAASTANINICSQIENMLFSINELSASTITINHGTSSSDDPVINVDIDFLFHPITPGLSMIANMTLHANSQMMMTPVALP
jgi:hypothetical protein